ncbi:MAG: hypothetical protein ABIN61_09210 [candidate division WOR-3 bacterium]
MKDLRFQIFSRSIKKIWNGIIIGILIIIFGGCGREWEERHVSYHAPNWTSDGRIIFFEEIWIQRLKEGIDGPIVIKETQEFTLYEVDNRGVDYEEIGEVCNSERGFFSIEGSSSAGEYVVFGLSGIGNNDNEIWVIKRDGTGLQKVGEGQNPDFSPDASKIVYEKPGEGIWIMDRDGSNDHQIIADPDAKYPAWSPDDTLIAYGEYSTHIANLEGNSIREYSSWWFRDWGPLGSNMVMATNPYGLTVTINFISEVIDTISVFVTYESGSGYKWSPDGNAFIGYDGNWFVINRDGTGKWYLRP